MPLESLCIISQSTANSKQSYRPEWLKSGSNWHFFGLCDLEIWLMTLKTSRSRDLIAAAPLSRQRPTFYIWMTCVTLNFDLLIWKWCTAHCPLLGCICTWAVCVPGAMKRTQQKISNAPCDLDLWPVLLPRNGARQIVTSWVVCVSHMKCISQTGKEPRSGQGQNFEPTVWPWPLTFWPGMVCDTSSPHGLCVYHMYMKWFGPIGKEPHESGHGQNFKRPLWSWPLTFWPRIGARHIATSWVVCVQHMKWIGPIGMEPQIGHSKNLKRPLRPLTF